MPTEMIFKNPPPRLFWIGPPYIYWRKLTNVPRVAVGQLYGWGSANAFHARADRDGVVVAQRLVCTTYRLVRRKVGRGGDDEGED